MPAIRPRRSVLYMPGSNARALDKARSLAADGFIFDLEDAVAPDAKEAARRQVCEAVAAGGYSGREVVVRINALRGPWGGSDLAAAVAACPDAILLPKAESAEDVLEAGRRLDALGAPEEVALWVMLETPRAVLDPLFLARARAEGAGRRLAVAVMGTNDLAKETRARLVPGRAAFLPMLVACLLGARAAGLDVLDGVWGALKDEGGLRAECEAGRDLGFDGKTLIHPDQIATANAVWAPAESDVAAARRVIAAFSAPEAQGVGALQVDGRMVERLHAAMAERTVALAGAIAARGS